MTLCWLCWSIDGSIPISISRQSTSAVRKTTELGPRAKAKSVEAIAHLANVADAMRALLVNNDHSNAFACNICGARAFTELGFRVDEQLVVSCCDCRMGVLRQIPQDTPSSIPMTTMRGRLHGVGSKQTTSSRPRIP